jgi:hypothetical protein
MAGTKPGHDGKQKPAPKTMPFCRPGIGWKAACAVPFLIANESCYVNARMPFLEASDMAGIVRG